MPNLSKQASSSDAQKIWTPSNIITITRILLVPAFVAALLAPWPDWFGLSQFDGDWKNIVAAAIFVFISGTDWLDGYLARSRNEVTDFGKFMDPLADKILVCAALICLVELGKLPTWVVLVILAREFIVSGVRMMAASKGVVIAASMLGKFKTVFQMIAIVLFTVKDSHMIGDISEAFNDWLWMLSWAIMLIALGLTIASMVDYLYKGRELLGFGSAESASKTGDAGESAHELATLVVGEALRARVTLGTAESLTGGLIGAALTSVAGSSDAYLGSIVSYTNEVKHAQLGVDANTLETYGAVSEQTAKEMASGARRELGCDVAVAVTGIAGPGGAEPGKPVGTVWMGVSTESTLYASSYCFDGNREEVRRQTLNAALRAFLNEIQNRNDSF